MRAEEERKSRDGVVGRGFLARVQVQLPETREERRNFRCSPLFFSLERGNGGGAPLSESWRLLADQLSGLPKVLHSVGLHSGAPPVFMSGVTERALSTLSCSRGERKDWNLLLFPLLDNFRTPCRSRHYRSAFGFWNSLTIESSIHPRTLENILSWKLKRFQSSFEFFLSS